MTIDKDKHMNRLLLVDDDIDLATMLRDYLEQEGYRVSLAHDGATGLQEALTGRYALVILDVMMPRLSGVEVLGRLRARGDQPVIMLTARGDDVDRIIGLEMGADDYVPKPCTARELVARVRSVLRRYQARELADFPAGVVRAGALALWPERRRAEWHDVNLDLTSTEFNILLALARSAGQAVKKNELCLQALGRPLARFDRSIDVHVSNLRHKLGARPGGEPWILAVRGIGYQLLRD
jgi:DNA-binding response OmpR family regulator